MITNAVEKHKFYFGVKRVLDFFVAIIGIVLSLIPMIVVGIIIRVDSKGPVIFTQDRVGYKGKIFRLLKFRTMYEGADKMEKEILKRSGADFIQSEDDDRVTKVGRVLRRFSIDEMPQIYNILMGKMSLIGPRPLIPLEVKNMNDDQRRRFHALPGITGLAQINGRSVLNAEQKALFDIEYIDNFSFKQDVIIFFKTIPAVVQSKNTM